MRITALIVAGGKSERFGGDVPKQFRSLCGRPMLSWCIESFDKASTIDNIVVVVAEEYLLYTSERVIDPYGFNKVSKIVPGGPSRRESVYSGLKAIPLSTNFVAIHDGARPLIVAEDIDRVVKVAIQERAAILAVKAADTVKRVRDSFVISTLERDSLFMAQTPQVFQYDLITEAHRDCEENGGDETITDDASLVEKRGFKVKTVEPSAPNFKVTSSEDLLLAEAVLKGRAHD